MSRGKQVTRGEFEKFCSLLVGGMKTTEAAERLGRRFGVYRAWALRNGMDGRFQDYPDCGYKPIPKLRKVKETPATLFPEPQPKAKTLDDFTPREIIRHLYGLGYRIEDGKLFVIQKHEVKINSVINE